MRTSLNIATARYSGALSLLANPKISPEQVQRGVSILAGATKKDSDINMHVLAHVLSTRPEEQMAAVKSNLRTHFTRVAIAANALLRARTTPTNIHPTVAGFFTSLARP